MRGIRSTRATGKRALFAALAIGAVVVLAPKRSEAHFTLDAPTSWMTQDASGSPQKQSPCGNEAGGTATGTVTAFQAGETITLKWTERIAHDGWFRIALSYNNRTDLTDPPYAINASGLSTDAGIESPVVAPVLADGLFPHSAASITVPKAYSYNLTLPMMSCAKCTLQVIQIMLEHPDNQPYGYTYHHCADISIHAGADGGTTASDAAANDVSAGGSAEAGGSSDSGGSSVSASSGSSSGSNGSSGSSGSSSGSSGSSGTPGGSSGASVPSSGGSGGSEGADASTEHATSSSGGGGGCSLTARRDGLPAVAGLAGLAALASATWRRRRS
jgi:hypothetical protein